MIWHYDGTFDGFLSGVFAIYQAKDSSATITRLDEMQQSLDPALSIIDVCTDIALAQRVQNKIEDISHELMRTLYKAWLCEDPAIDQDLLFYIRLALRTDSNPKDRLYYDDVRRVHNAAHKVGTDAYHHLQFIRFVPAGPRLYAADITPTYDILIMLGGAFSDRLAGQRFLIRDLVHRKTLASEGDRFWINDDPALLLPKLQRGDRFETMWQTYFHHIAIPERINPRLQTQLVPKRYRHLMTEFQRSPMSEHAVEITPPSTLPHEAKPKPLLNAT